MALVDKDHMTELRSAADARLTAETAEVDIQLQAVAYAINSASNTGQLRATFQGVLLDEVKSALEENGYTTQSYGVNPNNLTVISWKQ